MTGSRGLWDEYVFGETSTTSITITTGLKLLLTAAYIDINGGQNHKALDDILERKVYAGLVEPFVENAYNDGSDQGAVHSASAACEAGSADYDCGDRV